MIIEARKMAGIYEITLSPVMDKRGFFMQTYDKEIFEKYNINRDWARENHSFSGKDGIIRGLHFQFPPYCETKLIRCIKGAIFDVFVDLRKNSSTFGEWDSIELSEKNRKLVYVPRGFAHGFCTLVDDCEVLYRVDNFYKPEAEGGIIWNDKTLDIKWPVNDPILSNKDANLMTFEEFVSKYRGLEI